MCIWIAHYHKAHVLVTAQANLLSLIPVNFQFSRAGPRWCMFFRGLLAQKLSTRCVTNICLCWSARRPCWLSKAFCLSGSRSYYLSRSGWFHLWPLGELLQPTLPSRSDGLSWRHPAVPAKVFGCIWMFSCPEIGVFTGIDTCHFQNECQTDPHSLCSVTFFTHPYVILCISSISNASFMSVMAVVK